MPIRLGRSNNANDNNGGNGFLTFWGMVGATMAALKMKERWDEYRSVPSEANAPPAYRDDEEGAITLGSPLDTSINVPTRQKTRRGRNCCMCCGINCTLFCKALGIVILIFTVWNAFKLARWALTPSPTGLEDMPEYSKSLGCLDAKHYLDNNAAGAYYTIDVGSKVDHEIVLTGGAVGTLVVAPSTTIDESVVKIQASIRTDDVALLQNVLVKTSANDARPPNVDSDSFFALSSPSTATIGSGHCVRYDVTVYLPPNLRKLQIKAKSIAQIKFSDDFVSSPRYLGSMQIELSGRGPTNMLLPTAGLAADNTIVSMRSGYFVGAIDVANSTAVDTNFGDAVTKLDVVTTAYDLPESGSSSDASVAFLTTVTGSGRSDFKYINRMSRPVHSEHTSRGQGDMYLTYEKAGFNGMVQLDARSYTARGVRSDGKLGDAKQERWVGNKDGGDVLKVSTLGWVGLYF